MFRDFVNTHHLTFPIVYVDNFSLFGMYNVGYEWGRIPPSWFVIDKEGVIQLRRDNAYDSVTIMYSKMNELLNSN